MSQEQKPPSPQKEERIPRRVKTALFALGGVLFLCVIAAVATSLFSPATRTDDVAQLEATLDRKLHSLPDEGLLLKFNHTKSIPGGPGLQDWLQPVENRTKIRSVSIDYVALYSIDKAGDWEITIRDGRLHVLTPPPDLKLVNVEPATLKIETDGELTPQERDVASQILRENLAAVVREEEERGRAARLGDVRGQLRSFIAGIFRGEDESKIEIAFPGEGSLPEEGP